MAHYKQFILLLLLSITTIAHPAPPVLNFSFYYLSNCFICLLCICSIVCSILFSSFLMGKMMKKVAIYARVSTVSQTTENQLLELRATAQRMGYTIVAEFVDNGISGARC